MLGRPPVGLTGTVSSDLPAGAGLSSSAALEVAVALALCAVADWELEPLELALACQRAELRAVGVPCGILDQAAQHPRLRRARPCSSTAGRSSTGSSRCRRGGAPDRRLGCRAKPREHGLRDASGRARGALRAVGAERSTTVELSDLGGLDECPARRLRHVVTENERVRRFAAALESGDCGARDAPARSHASLRDDYEVSVPELDLLVVARRVGRRLRCEAAGRRLRRLGRSS